MEPKSACKSLVLDAGPLLSLSPLRGLASHYFTVPQVLSELKDRNAREHFERLALTTGVKVEVLEPDATSISKVIQFAKTTGDYSVLSYADICVLALTLALDTAEKAEGSKLSTVETNTPVHLSETPTAIKDDVDDNEWPKEQANTESVASTVDQLAEKIEDLEVSDAKGIIDNEPQNISAGDAEQGKQEGEDEAQRVSLDIVLERIDNDSPESSSSPPYSAPRPLCSTGDVSNAGLFEDPSDEDDGEGNWITPANVDSYKTRAMDLYPSADSTDLFTTVSRKNNGWKGRKAKPALSIPDAEKQVGVGCMTADFAMQNVLLQMGLSLVGTEGKRIQKVKTWVLRCHACFKICKDSTKKFCPSCGNPSLLRTTVTAKAPTADDSTPALEVHLKKKFVYRTRGTIYSIPKPKSGTAKTGNGEGLILREDQAEYMRAVKLEEGRRERDEQRILKQSVQAANAGKTPAVKLGNWMDPDWLPEMLTTGAGGKGRHVTGSRVPVGPDGMPIVGYGRKNPNERRRKR